MHICRNEPMNQWTKPCGFMVWSIRATINNTKDAFWAWATLPALHLAPHQVKPVPVLHWEGPTFLLRYGHRNTKINNVEIHK